jgi:hypothetical protein
MCRSYIAERRRVGADILHGASEHGQVQMDGRS